MSQKKEHATGLTLLELPAGSVETGEDYALQ